MAGGRGRRRNLGREMVAVASVSTMVALGLVPLPLAAATSSGSPYEVPAVVDTNPDPQVIETTLVAQEVTVNVGSGVKRGLGIDDNVMATVWTFNGTIPGPEIRANIGDTIIVHFQNNVSEPTGIHWHGIELNNASDGTPMTQNQVAPGESFLYKFVVPRAGIFWYHPHHHASTNQVFKGMYGSVIVEDPNSAVLVANGTLPPAASTHTMVLSDTTVCRDEGENDTKFDPADPHVSGAAVTSQQTKLEDLCEDPIDDHGAKIGSPLEAGDVPHIQHAGTSGPVDEGQTVLTNGVNVGHREGSPAAPGALANGASTLEVQPGTGVRFQTINAAAIRYMRLRMTLDDGTDVPLIRVGGEGGLLDHARAEGGVVNGFDWKYSQGEILLGPGNRADIVAVIPDDATGVATIWTQDFARTGSGFTRTPTVPVAHLEVTGAAADPPYQLAGGDPLRAQFPGQEVEALEVDTDGLLDPGDFGKPGMASETITLNNQVDADPDDPNTFVSSLGIDDVHGDHNPAGDYVDIVPHASARWVRVGDVIELQVENATTNSHHPFHPHGFSMQPKAMVCTDGGETHTYTYDYNEFVDEIDVPNRAGGDCILTYRVHIGDPGPQGGITGSTPRPLMDGVTPGGSLGRWVFHCHLFHHAVFGMISEIIVVPETGNEKPFVNADDTLSGGTMTGTYLDPDDDDVTLTASTGTVTDNGDGTWEWSADGGSADSFQVSIDWGVPDGHDGIEVQAPQLEIIEPEEAGDPTIGVVTGEYQYGDNDDGSGFPIEVTVDPEIEIVYITATDSNDLADQVAFYHGLDQPAVVIDPDQVTEIDEFDSVVVTATFEVGSSSDGIAGFDLVVHNVDPDATIDAGETVDFNGVPTVVSKVGEEVTLSSLTGDPGSDDLLLEWDFDDGNTTGRLDLVNPPDDDPLPSPTVQPRSVLDEVANTFLDACLYEVTFTATDDDGGVGDDSAHVVVQGDADQARSSGYWRSEFRQVKSADFSAETLQCYLDIVNHVSAVFSDHTSLVTFEDAADILGGSGPDANRILESELLAAWLNFANGAYALDDLVDTTGNRVGDTVFHDLMAQAEALRTDPNRTREELIAMKGRLEWVNNPRPGGGKS